MSQERGKVLVLTSDREQGASLQGFLRGRGNDIVGAESRAQVVKAVEDGTVDLVVLDIDAERGDGQLCVCQAIRNGAQHRDIPIIVLNGRHRGQHGPPGSEDIPACTPADAFLERPADLSALAGKVEELLGAERKEAPASGTGDPISVRRLVRDTGWLIRLRWLAAVGMVAATIAAQYVFEIEVGTKQLLLAAAALAAFNLGFYVFFLRLRELGPDEATSTQARRLVHLQIVTDLVILTIALHYCGGVRNPIAVFYVFHVILASILLPVGTSYIHATLGAVLFASLGVIEHRWPELHFVLRGYDVMNTPPTWRILFAESMVLAATLYVAAYLAGTLASTLHKRERDFINTLASLRERSRQLQAANVKLSEVQERKEHFLYHAAHQLKSPLAAVDGCIAAVVEGYVEDLEKQTKLLEQARTRISSLFELVGDLLRLSRAREGVLPAGERLPVDLGTVVEKVLDLHKERATRKGISVSLQRTGGTSQLMGDEGSLRDVVANLVSNAIEYTPEGGQVKVKMFTREGHVVLEVIDTGIGIPEEEQKHLFTEFFRASNAKQVRAGGTGLGLTIVKEIVRQHGGTIAVDSLLNLGTCMRVSLPRV